MPAMTRPNAGCSELLVDLTLNYYRSFLISTDLITLQGSRIRHSLEVDLVLSDLRRAAQVLKCHEDEYFVI